MSELSDIVARLTAEMTAAFGDVDRRLLALEGELPPDPPAGTWPPIPVVPPSWTMVREITCTTRAQFDTAYNGALNGDRLKVNGVTFNGQLTLNKTFTGSGIEIVFDNACLFTGSTTAALNCVFISGATKHRIFGGVNMSNLPGHGILIYPSSDILWHGFKVVGQIGGTCLRVLAVNGDCARLDLMGEVSNNGWTPSLDPHAEKGTGMHPSYIGGDAAQTGTVKDSRFIIDAHDCQAGSNQIGAKGTNNDFYIRAKNLTKVATSQTAGNAVQLFGGLLSNLDIWVEADNVAQVVRVTNETMSNIRVNHGRGVNVRGNYDSSVKYMPNPGIVYTDCT